MPEIGEVARIVHYIRKHLVNKTLSKVTANVDDIVYGKVGTSAAEFEKHMTGKKIVDAGQQGKYFWMIMSSPPHPVMHFGMSGWFKIRSEHTYYYRKKENEPDEEWPPKYVKFLLKAEGGGKTEEAAFVDARRLGRIRLVHCDAKDIRNNSPLKENGPDPVIDKDLVSLEWLTEKCRKKKVPIKAMLLDQANISGIGNWVADEIMYNAKMHPEQYANTLQDSQIKQLHKSIHYVCGLACELLADSDQFPEDWLFKHRWGKGKKASHKLPNGNRIEFLKVGGRTSAVVPAVQKKTGPVAGDIGEDAGEEEDSAEESDEKSAKKKSVNNKRKPKVEEAEEVEESDQKPAKKKSVNNKRKAKVDEVEEAEESDEKPVKKSVSRKRKAEDDAVEEAEAPPKKTASKRGKANGVKAEAVAETNDSTTKQSNKRGKKAQDVKTEVVEEVVEKPKKVPVRGKAARDAKEENAKAEIAVKAGRSKKAAVSKTANTEVKEEDSGRRRSGRLRK